MKIHLIERIDYALHVKTACGLAISKSSSDRIIKHLKSISISRFDYEATVFEAGMPTKAIIATIADALSQAYTRGLLSSANRHSENESERIKILADASSANVESFESHAQRIWEQITYSDAPKP